MHGPASQSDCDGDWSNWAGDTDKRASGSVDIPNYWIEGRKAGGATSVTLIKNVQKERVCSFHFMYCSVSWLSTNKTSEEEGERDISTYVLLYGKFISHDHGLHHRQDPRAASPCSVASLLFEGSQQAARGGIVLTSRT
jgi:hypothetical protein